MIRKLQESGERLGVIRLGLIMLAILLLPNCRPAFSLEMTPELRKVVDGAKAEGKLTVESPPNLMGGGDSVKEAADWIKREFGVTLTTAYTPNPNNRGQAGKLYAELQAHVKASTDAFLAAAVPIEALLDTGLFASVPWPALMPGRITPQIAEADNRALRILTRFPGILYNKSAVPQMADVQSMYDLLKPSYKGKFATTPDLGGLDGFVAQIGYDKSVEYFKAMAEQISGIIPCGSQERIASGEVPALAFDCAGTAQTQDRFKDFLALRIVPDAALRRYQYLAIPTNAPEPNAGILFGLYLSSSEGQAANRTRRRDGDLDTYPDSVPSAAVAEAEKENVKFRDIDIGWAADHRDMAKQIENLIKIISR